MVCGTQLTAEEVTKEITVDPAEGIPREEGSVQVDCGH